MRFFHKICRISTLLSNEMGINVLNCFFVELVPSDYFKNEEVFLRYYIHSNVFGIFKSAITIMVIQEKWSYSSMSCHEVYVLYIDVKGLSVFLKFQPELKSIPPYLQ